MTKLTFVLFLLAFFALTVAAQQQVVEPGKPQELKGVTRIFVNAPDDETRNNIIAQIQKRLPHVMISERPADAEVWLFFAAAQRNSPKSDPTMGIDSRTSGTSIVYEMVGSGSVIKPISKDSAHRLIEFKDTLETTASFSKQALSTKFARAFIKSYQKANPKGNSGGGSPEPEVTVARY
jgi:hypothetical protein